MEENKHFEEEKNVSQQEKDIDEKIEVLKKEINDIDKKDNPDKELTEEEEKELYIQLLKESRIKFRPIKHDGNITTNQFGAKYKQKRKRRNSLAKKSRKANRK